MNDYQDAFTQGREEALTDVRELFEDAADASDFMDRVERLLYANGVM